MQIMLNVQRFVEINAVIQTKNAAKRSERKNLCCACNCFECERRGYKQMTSERVH